MLIEEGAARAGERARRCVEALWRGCEDEDVWVVPGVGWRLPAAGLTHTQRPGRGRGELWMPSAGATAARLLKRAQREGERGGEQERAYWVGRACHLLGDAAVPARARGVWHVLGDPLERWLEGHVEVVRAQPPLEEEVEAAVGEVRRSRGGERRLFEGLAQVAARYPADTTRTPWGAGVYWLLGRGLALDEGEVEAQGRALVPHAVAYTAALLRCVLGDDAG
jgi:hypothetical protein